MVHLENRSFEVQMDEFALTRSSCSKNRLYTKACYDYVGVSGWDRNNKVGFVAHFLPTDDVQAVFDRFFVQYASLCQKPSRLQVRVVSGLNNAITIAYVQKAIFLWRYMFAIENFSEQKGTELYLDTGSDHVGRVASEVLLSERVSGGFKGYIRFFSCADQERTLGWMFSIKRFFCHTIARFVDGVYNFLGLKGGR